MIKIIFENSYLQETLQGKSLSRAINERYLKKIVSVWQEAYSVLQTMTDTCIALRTNMTMYTSPLDARWPRKLGIVAI